MHSELGGLDIASQLFLIILEIKIDNEVGLVYSISKQSLRQQCTFHEKVNIF